MDPILAAVLISWLICRRAWNRDEETDTPAARGRQTGPAPSRAAQRAPRYGFVPFLKDNWRDYWGRRYDALAAARDARPASTGRKPRWRDRWRARLNAADAAVTRPPVEPTGRERTAADDEPSRPKLTVIDGGKPDDPPAKPERAPHNTPTPKPDTKPHPETTTNPNPTTEGDNVNTEATGVTAIREALKTSAGWATTVAEDIARYVMTLRRAAEYYETSDMDMNPKTLALIRDAADQAAAAQGPMTNAGDLAGQARASFDANDATYAEPYSATGHMPGKTLVAD